MTKKQESEALTSLEKLEELTQDILKNSTNGGDPNFRQIVFTGLTQTKNPILLDKMKEILLSDKEEDLKKTIILGIFNHKEMFAPVIEYGEKNITMPYIDESYDNKDSFLFVLDALIELSYKNKLNEFESAIPLLFQIYKIACSEKSTSTLADKLLQSFLNSRIGTVKELQGEFVALIKDSTNEINSIIIAIDILSRAQFKGVLAIVDEIFDKANESDNVSQLVPLLDISTLALNYYAEPKYDKQVQKLLKKVQTIDFEKVENSQEIVNRIKNRIKKLQNDSNSKN